MEEQHVYEATTFPELFRRRCQVSKDRVAYEYETSAGWVEVTFGEYEQQVRETVCGLLALGMNPGDRVAVWGDTEPEWTIADLATMALSGSTAGIYQTNTPEQAAYIIKDANATVVVVDGPDRLEQALSVRGDTPGVKFYVTWRGAADSENVYTLDDLRAKGREYARGHENAYEDAVVKVQPDMTAVLIYTSGTTGPPKGVMLSHTNCLFCCRATRHHLHLSEDDGNIAFLPMSHVAEHVVSFFGRIYGGSRAYYMPDMNRFSEVAKLKKPTVVSAVPRVYEKAYAAIMDRVQGAPTAKRALFNWALKVGDEVAHLKIAKKEIPATLKLRHAIADKLVFKNIRAAFGGNIRFLGSGAAPISIEIVKFFNAAGMPLVEVYGMTECSGISHINAPDDYKIGTVGKVIKGFECKLAEDGEILVRGDGVFQGYLNKPDATAETIDGEGWLHTGDIGEVDDEGFLRITDRKKNLIITAGGKNVAPANSEMLIKRDPLISQVLVIGDKRKFLTALVTLAPDHLEKLRESANLDGKSVEEIVESDAVRERVDQTIQAANKELARYENIRKYKIIGREFSIEEGEMTPSMKLKRKVIEEKFSNDIERLYSE